MKNKKIVAAGGAGFIGQGIINYFGKDNTIIVLSRMVNEKNNLFTKSKLPNNVTVVEWNGKDLGEWCASIEGADVVINFAGKSVNCRYSAKNKQAIFDSRVYATKALGKAIQQSTHPPALWINASSATIYPHAIDTPRDENFTDFADDFSVQVCKRWEKTFFDQPTITTRKVALRMAITLGKGGVMTPYLNLVKYGLGGRQGSGKQMFSWIHIEDICRIIDFITDHSALEGVYNASAPNPVTNKVFMQTLRKAVGYKIGLPAFTWMLKIGAFIMGTETELLLKSRWVLPTKLMQKGFVFKYPNLALAFESIIHK